MNASADNNARLRWSVYWLLIAIAVGGMMGRILAVDSVNSVSLKRPFLSANDRSRWATVRSLVEQHTYAIDDIVSQPGWDTIDMVKHVGRDGQPHLYSSKPPLMATLLAGPYFVIYTVSGADLGRFPYEIGRFLLVLVNVLPMLLYFVVLAMLAERLGTSDWGRIFMVAAGALGTFLTTFVVTLNNHTPAAVCAALTLWAVVRILYDGSKQLRYFVSAGLFSRWPSPASCPRCRYWPRSPRGWHGSRRAKRFAASYLRCCWWGQPRLSPTTSRTTVCGPPTRTAVKPIRPTTGTTTPTNATASNATATGEIRWGSIAASLRS